MSSKLMSESVSSISPTTALWGVSVCVWEEEWVGVFVCESETFLHNIDEKRSGERREIS